MSKLKNYGEKIAENGLKIEAIIISPDNPFRWASGYMMPIYNDNRMFLNYPGMRELNTLAFIELINSLKIKPTKIAGTSTAGISPGTSVADRLFLSFNYVRDKPKDHGLKNQIEGIAAHKDLSGEKIILIEDLISTGGSSANAVQSIRDAKGECNYCLSIFNYGLDKGVEAFNSLNPKCEVHSLLTYDILLRVAKEMHYLTNDQVKLLEEWRSDPFGWGEKHGFPRVEKK